MFDNPSLSTRTCRCSRRREEADSRHQGQVRLLTSSAASFGEKCRVGRTPHIFLLLLLLLLTRAATALEIGEKPGAVELRTFDGRPVTMTNYSERRATVVLFLSARCDATESAVADINRLNTAFRLREVLLVGVFANPGETGEEIRRYAQHRGLVFPVYRDVEGRAARQFGAGVTPEAFLLDRGGALLYRGAVGSRDEGIYPAVSSLLANEPIQRSAVPAQGTNLGRKAPKREVADPHGSIAFSSELIFERIPGRPAHHASTITEAANGDLLAVWYGGSYESADDEALFLSRRKKGSRNWSRPEILVENSLQPPGNAVVFRDGRNRIWIVWGRMEASRPIRRGAGWGKCRLFYRISSNHGMTWSEDTILTNTLGWLPRNVPVTLSSGELLLPLSGRVDGKSGSFFYRTRDHGQTWQLSEVIAGGSQPTIAERRDGTLLALMRHDPRILQSESTDGGQTWSQAAKTDLKNPGAGIAMTRLSNSHLVLVFNDSETDRSPLSISRSLDEGRTWQPPLHLESNPGEYSYPCVIQTADGRLHITYTFRRFTIKHVEMNEDWLEFLQRPN